MGKNKKKQTSNRLPKVKGSGGTSIEQKRWASKQGRSHISHLQRDRKGKT